ncbi:MAG: MarR family transcriptional regulator [Clostridia bacterium]|nr:MarR family transcriptional regulator [Clostridia bacterium]
MNSNIKLMMALQKLNLSFIEKAEKNIGRLGISVTEFLILAHLNLKDVEKTQKLGEIANITSGTITYTVNKLVQRGYVRQYQDDNDRRIFMISITEAGRNLYKTVFDEHLIFLNKMLSGINEDEKINLIEQLNQLEKSINMNQRNFS